MERKQVKQIKHFT